MGEKSKPLGIAEILAAGPGEVEAVDCPEWGGVVFVRSMSGDDRDRIDGRFGAGKDMADKLVGLRAAVVAACLCDAAGERIDCKPDEIKSLGQTDGAALDRVFTAAQRVSGLTERDVKELEKN